MKKVTLLVLLGITFLLCDMNSLYSQSSSKMGSMIKKVLVDTTLVTAAEVTLEPGQKTEVHTHPAHFFYALTAGQLTVSFTDGTKEVLDLTPGFSGFGSPERPHSTQNTGKTTVKFLIVELKEHPYKGNDKMK